MTHIDTNFLVRLLTNDVPAQAEQAIEAVSSYGSKDILVLDTVLAELFFVLEFHEAYELPRAEIAARFHDLLKALPQLRLEPQTMRAFTLYESEPKLDFTDCVLAIASGMKQGGILTFDKDLLRLFMRVQ